LTRLVALLSRGRRHEVAMICLVHVKSVSEMPRNPLRHRACRQQFGEHPMAVANLTVAETVDKLAPTHSECSGAVQDESAYRIIVFSEARLNRCRTH
jgi:hypothetical protein